MDGQRRLVITLAVEATVPAEGLDFNSLVAAFHRFGDHRGVSCSMRRSSQSSGSHDLINTSADKAQDWVEAVASLGFPGCGHLLHQAARDLGSQFFDVGRGRRGQRHEAQALHGSAAGNPESSRQDAVDVRVAIECATKR